MRKLTGPFQKAFYLYVLAMGLFHLYTAVFCTYEAYLQRMIHLTWVLPMAFVMYPICKSAPQDRVPWYDWILAAISVTPGIYAMIHYEEITMRIVQVDPVTCTQLVLGLILVFFLLEATRRFVGWPLALIGAFFAGYMYFGHLMPGIMRGLPFTLHEVVEEIYLTDEGVFSIPLGVSATFVMIFLIFGGFLEKSGIGNYFMELAQAFAGTAAGGPAKISVVSSALFGSISGAAVANVYGTGTFTIPLMKRIGYPPFFAGAVESVASTGGQIMPPVMGAGAFIMASLLGIQYKEVMVAAILPALLYYGAVLLMVHLGALKNGLKGLAPEDLPSKKAVIKRIYMMIPIVGLVYLLLTGYTPMLAAVIGVGLAWFVSLFEKENRMGPRAILDAIYIGSKNITVVAIACATAGIVVGSVSLTGFGFKFVGLVHLLALVLIMLVSLVLGMGLPTTGAYILAAALGVPALAKLGFPPLAAHFFVFYYAIISNITPPVALAAYAASSIAGSEPNRTGFAAMKLGVLAFIVPFAWCYDMGVILHGTTIQNIAAVIGGVGALFAMGYAMMGFIRRPIPLWVRGLFTVAGLLCFFPFIPLKLAGVGGTIVLWFLFKGSKEIQPAPAKV